MSAATFVELAAVIDQRGNQLLSRRLDELIETLGIGIVDVDVEQAQRARQAYVEYGRGSGSPARLNFGDCFSYALAAVRREPLLFKGDDFGHTDVGDATAP
jgi:ribonuclease VapC